MPLLRPKDASGSLGAGATDGELVGEQSAARENLDRALDELWSALSSACDRGEERSMLCDERGGDQVVMQLHGHSSGVEGKRW